MLELAVPNLQVIRPVELDARNRTAWLPAGACAAGLAELWCPKARERAMHELVIRPDWAQQISQLRGRLTEDTHIIR